MKCLTFKYKLKCQSLGDELHIIAFEKGCDQKSFKNQLTLLSEITDLQALYKICPKTGSH
jgi:hypothetical protein